MHRKLITAAALLLALSAPAGAESIGTCGETIPAIVTKIQDGDSITVHIANCGPRLLQTQIIRLRGCDTPELKDKRPEVAAKARAAKDFVAAKVKPGDQVILQDVKRDKFGGRLLARMEIEGKDLCVELIKAGLAKPYAGGKRSW